MATDYIAVNLANWNSRVPFHEQGYGLAARMPPTCRNACASTCPVSATFPGSWAFTCNATSARIRYRSHGLARG